MINFTLHMNEKHTLLQKRTLKLKNVKGESVRFVIRYYTFEVTFIEKVVLSSDDIAYMGYDKLNERAFFNKYIWSKFMSFRTSTLLSIANEVKEIRDELSSLDKA